MKLTEQKMGEIAIKALVQKLADDNTIPNAEGLKRGLPDQAKKLGITTDEAKAFMKAILPRVIGARLGCKEVSLVWEGDEFR